MRFVFAVSSLLLLDAVQGFSIVQTATSSFSIRSSSSTALFALDDQMISRLDGIRRSYLTLTERLGDPDVLANTKLLQKVMSDRASSEEVVLVYEEFCGLKEELEGARELFQEAGDDPDMKEMARAEMKEIEPQMEGLEEKMKLLLLPKDPNDERNIMLEIRAGTGGSEASIFCGEFVLAE
jgi:peptide chain release factor 1